MKAWAECYSRGEVMDFHIARSPYIHTDGEKYEFILVVVCMDGREIPMRVRTVQRLAELAAEFTPQRIHVGSADFDVALAMRQCVPGASVH
jgi:hypothetical protein